MLSHQIQYWEAFLTHTVFFYNLASSYWQIFTVFLLLNIGSWKIERARCDCKILEPWLAHTHLRWICWTALFNYNLVVYSTASAQYDGCVGFMWARTSVISVRQRGRGCCFNMLGIVTLCKSIKSPSSIQYSRMVPYVLLHTPLNHKQSAG